MSRYAKYVLWDLGARLCAALPPLGVTLYYFPLWVKESAAATVSGAALVAMLVCLIPFWKKLFQIGSRLTETSMPLVWAVILGVLLLLRAILDQTLVISLVGLLSSFVSMGLCTVRNRYRNETKEGECK